jgi:ketosteroid isomerase-like protein
MDTDAIVPEFFKEHSTQAETEIRTLEHELAKAIREGDLRKIMSFYSEDVRAFDMMPPSQFINKSSYQKEAWEECFTDVFEFPVEFEQHDLRIHADGDVAYSHCLIHMKGMTIDGQMLDAWTRNTTGWKKMGGHWLIVHEHNSVPLDKESGLGLMTLAP